MTITAPPAIPLITDPSTFAVRAQDWVVWQAEQLYPALVGESALLGLSLSGSSVTSNTVGTGSKSFTVETGKGFAAGQSVVVADSVTPTNRMFGVVDTYDSGTGVLVFISQAFEGSGTLTAWSISPTLNAVLTASQIPDGLITNAKLDNGYIDDLAIVTLDPTADYVAIADGSDSGNKKKALIPTISKLQPIAASVAGNALTVTLNPTVLDFIDSTIAVGTIHTRNVPAAISVTVSSGSTLGGVNGEYLRLGVIAIDNAGTVELAVVNFKGGLRLTEDGLISTTAEGGAGAADTARVAYSTTARSNVPYRVVGFIEISQATAGTWVTDPVKVIGAGGLSTIPLSLNAIGGAPMFVCRAWISFDGTGTPSINGSGNVSSITDNGVGDYTLNFTTALFDANYSFSGMANIQGSNSNGLNIPTATPPTSSAFRFSVRNLGTGAAVDASLIGVAIFR